MHILLRQKGFEVGRALTGSAPTASELVTTTHETLDITDTDLYVKHGYPWAAWDLLRREAPVFWFA